MRRRRQRLATRLASQGATPPAAGRCALGALALVGCLCAGCARPLLSPERLLARNLVSLSASIPRQPDPELAREGSAALLLLLDGLLLEDPDNPTLLRAAADGYTAYTQAFLGDLENQERAAALSGRAREYGLRLLDRDPHLAAARRQSLEAFESALQGVTRRQAEGLYSACAAWLSWSAFNVDSMHALAELPFALAGLRRVLALDETCAAGGAHAALGMVLAAQPGRGQRDLDQSRDHFLRAQQIAGPKALLNQVQYAEFYLKTVGDRDLYVESLTRVSQSPQHEDPPELALANALARQRARYLLDHLDEDFVAPDEE